MGFTCQSCRHSFTAELGAASLQMICPACGKQAIVASPAHSKAATTGIRRVSQGDQCWDTAALFRCPKCAEHLEIDGARAGTSVRCPVCGLMFLAPKPSTGGGHTTDKRRQRRLAYSAAALLMLLIVTFLCIRATQSPTDTPPRLSSASIPPTEGGELVSPRAKQPAASFGGRHSRPTSFSAKEKTILLRLIAISIGLGYLIYGRKEARLAVFLCGLGLCMLPFFIASNLVAILVCLLLIAVPIVVRE
jgi:ribosomal protein S27E